MELISPGIGLMFWMVISFSVVVYVLGKFAWKPILSSLKERDQSIETALLSAEKAKEEMKALIFSNEKMKKEAFFRYDIDLSKFEEKEFEKLPIKEQKQILCACLDKNHLYVNLSEIDDASYKVSTDDKKLNAEFYKTVV